MLPPFIIWRSHHGWWLLLAMRMKTIHGEWLMLLLEENEEEAVQSFFRLLSLPVHAQINADSGD
jgi:hypothetical protein